MAKINSGLVHKLLQEVNPFGIIEKGGYNRYNTQVDAYNDLFMILWNYFPRGWIDVPLFMVTFQGIDYIEAQRLCVRDDIVRIPISDIEAEGRLEMLIELCKKLLKVTDCDFDINAFQQGLHKFNLMMMSECIQSRNRDKTIPKFTEKYYEPNYQNSLRDSEQQSSEHSSQPEEQLGGIKEE